MQNVVKMNEVSSFMNFTRVISSEEFNTSATLLSMCRLYCRIWAEEPWNEPDWKESEVKKDFLGQIEKRGAIAFLATQTTTASVLGFSWGYKVSLDNLAKISGNTKFCDLLKDASQIFYIDELAVDKPYRKSGIGYTLSNLLLKSAISEGAQIITLRTDNRATPAKKLYHKMGFKELPIVDAIYNDRTYWFKKV